MKKQLISILCCTALCMIVPSAEAQNTTVHVAKYKGDKTCAISYTFDDGMKEHYTVAAPKLEQYGFRGTFWVNGATVNRAEGAEADTTRTTWAELKEMADNGHEISNHGWSHKNLVKSTIEEATYEIKKNDSVFREKLGFVPVTFCYAYNARNEEVLKIASENRVGTRTHQFDIGSKSTTEILEKRIHHLLEKGEWGVGMTHGITYGYDAFGDPQVFWEHLKKVKALEDKIWVGTFREVAAYAKERDAIRLQIAESKQKLIVLPTLPLDKELFNEPLTAIIDKQGVKKISVKQGKRKLDVRILPDKVLFDFDPSGGTILIQFE